MKIIVVDLDGTLCDSSHRDHLAQAKEWDAFHAASKDDKPRLDVAELVKIVRSSAFAGRDYCLVALTGRNEKYRKVTLDWLIRQDLAHFDALLMRPDNDWRPDTVIKPELLEEFRKLIGEGQGGPTPEVAFILEDRDHVVEAWRNLGYACWQVQPGGY